jgi:hypothetical protein
VRSWRTAICCLRGGEFPYPFRGKKCHRLREGHNAGDSNLYRYITNNPTTKRDPSGLQEAGQITAKDVQRFADQGKKGALKLTDTQVKALLLQWFNWMFLADKKADAKLISDLFVQNPGLDQGIQNLLKKEVFGSSSTLTKADTVYSPNPKVDRLLRDGFSDIIRRMGAPAFATRERATAEWIAAYNDLGFVANGQAQLAARAQLRLEMDQGDPEIRRRGQDVLAQTSSLDFAFREVGAQSLGDPDKRVDPRAVYRLFIIDTYIDPNGVRRGQRGSTILDPFAPAGVEDPGIRDDVSRMMGLFR